MGNNSYFRFDDDSKTKTRFSFENYSEEFAYIVISSRETRAVSISINLNELFQIYMNKIEFYFCRGSTSKFRWIQTRTRVSPNGLLARCGLRMRRECRERFLRHRLQRNWLVSDPGMHHGTCVTHVPWFMPGSPARGGGENVPGIPGACTTHNFTYLTRGPLGVVNVSLPMIINMDIKRLVESLSISSKYHRISVSSGL